MSRFSPVYKPDSLLASMLASAALAPVGSRRAAFNASLVSAWGSGCKVRIYRWAPGTSVPTRVFDATVAGALTSLGVAVRVVTTDVTQNAIGTADISTGYWELRIEHGANPDQYFGCALTQGGGDQAGSLNASLVSGAPITKIDILFRAPAWLDQVQPTRVQSSPMATVANGSKLTLTLPNQPAARSKLIIDLAFGQSAGVSTFSPAALAADKRRLWFDANDVSTLKLNVDGTGATPVPGNIVKRINNKGSLGGYLTNATGWTLVSVAGGLRLRSNGAQGVYASVNFVWEEVLPVAVGGEVNWAGQVDGTFDPGGNAYHYSRNLWVAGDGAQGVSAITSTVLRAFNYDGGPETDGAAIAYTSASDMLATWQRTGGAPGSVTGNSGTTPTLAAPVATGNPTPATGTPFSLGGPWHMGGGSWPLFIGEFSTMVAGAALTSAERQSVKAWQQFALTGGLIAGSALTVTDNSGKLNVYTTEETTVAADGSLQLARIVCHTVAPKAGASTDDFIVEVTLPRTGYDGAAVLYEYENLLGLASWDEPASAVREVDATTGTMTIGTAPPAQELNAILASFAVKNSSPAVGLAVAGMQAIGSTQDGTVVAMAVASRLETARNAQAVVANWSGNTAGKALGLVSVLKAGTNVDPLPADTPAPGVEPVPAGVISVTNLKNDVDPSIPNDMLPAVVPLDFDWATKARPGLGPNPPAGWSGGVAWGEFFTKRDAPPGNKNVRIAVRRLVHLDDRGGSWRIVRDCKLPSDVGGVRILQYQPQVNGPIDVRWGVNGNILEARMPSDGGIYHFWQDPRSIVPDSGAVARAALMLCGLVPDNPSLPDDRASYEAAAHTGGDYWRYGSGGGPGEGDNNDWGIARCRALTATMQWYAWHTFGVDDAKAQRLQTALISMGLV